MGESTNPRATLRFDRRVRLEFHGATITSDAGTVGLPRVGRCTGTDGDGGGVSAGESGRS